MNRSPSILMVDKDPLSVALARDSLDGMGHAIEVLRSPAEVAERVRRTASPDLVLVDTAAPEVEGLEVCRIVKSVTRGAFLPVIIVSARGDLETKLRCLDSGADGYVIKPYSPRELRARVASMLRIRQVHKNLLAEGKQLERLSATDALTGLRNRRALQSCLREETRRAIRYKQPLSLLMLDIDHFSAINERVGHPGGDHVLERVSRVLTAALREVDILARYGGEEFVALLPQTDAHGAWIVAERLRQIVERTDIPFDGTHLTVTLSVGVASMPGCNGHLAQNLLSEADRALYEAKRSGRNTTRLAQDLRAHQRDPEQVA